MKKSVRVLWLICFTVVAVMSISNSARADFFGGNEIIPRQFGDSATGITFIDLTNRVISNGSLTSWSVFATAGRPVTLNIFRENGDDYNLVGSSPQVITGDGPQMFSLTAPIAVQANDIIGWSYVSGVSASGIFFDSGVSGANTLWTYWQDGQITGSIPKSGFVAYGDWTNRVYSIRVEGNPVPLPPALFLLAPGLVGLIGLRKKYLR